MTASAAGPAEGNLTRFSGFADLYDEVRPMPPADLGSLVVSYAGSNRPKVVDLGSGSGLSSRWAATWAGSVIGVEPNDDMRAVAESHPAPGVTYRPGLSHRTGLADGSADVVLVVQAMHWMEPGPTLEEIARVLRPGGVLAVADTDWPPVAGSARAERAWVAVDRWQGIFEKRMAAGETGPDLHRPPEPPGEVVSTLDMATAAGVTDRGAGARSWGKSGHLPRMTESGRFAFTRELVLHSATRTEYSATGTEDAERFIALMRSQGSYQRLRRAGLSDEELGVSWFEAEVRAGFGERPGATPLVFGWRVRLGVTAA